MNEITILNENGELARVVLLLDRLGAEHRVAPSILADMQIAVDEVLKNLIDHAYPDDAAHEILLRFEVSDNMLQAVIEDDGVPFDPLSSPAPNLGMPLRERSPGGLGLHFVRKLMSEMSYDRVGNRNRLVLRKRLNT
jgi:anti-sigma regulatory factor (Ser/Thr protein kinase)